MSKPALQSKRSERVCIVCGADSESAQLLTIYPQIWRKPKGLAVKRNTCLKIGRGVVICDGCALKAFSAGAKRRHLPLAFRVLSERVMDAYNVILDAVKAQGAA